jgi:multidrug efflux pump subunit AcrA (membrane-fusion protein)
MHDKLQALSRNKQGRDPIPAKRPDRRRWRQVIAKSIPWGLAVGAILLIVILFGDRFLPAASVVVEPVVTLPGKSSNSSTNTPTTEVPAGNPYTGSALFQASGWIEADPFPHRATALASGVVEAVHVLEGQSVKAGEPIATLIQEDARLRLDGAEASLAAARASLEEAASGYELAMARIESMRRQIEVAEARRKELSDLAVRAEDLGREVLAEQDIIQAGLKLRTQEQEVDALRAQLREREIEAERLEGQLQVRTSMLSVAEVRLQEAELEFDRMTIRAPVDGIVQRLMVAPGQKKLLMADNPESATVAVLFQPDQLQARIDVPIAEAARLSVGQAVLVESEFLGGVELQGYIQRIVGEADLSRNTLQVKVRIEDPPAGLPPEILCRAQFLATKVAGINKGPAPEAASPSVATSVNSLQILVPKPALFDDSGSEASVWAVDPTGRHAEHRRVSLSGEELEGYALVNGGLRPGDRVVVQSSTKLRDGSRIRY